MDEKAIIEYVTTPANWPQVAIVVFLTARLFPEFRQYIPELWQVYKGEKKLSSIRIKQRDLPHFDHKRSYVAWSVINESDCTTFHARLMAKVEAARAAGEPVTFSFVGIKTITSAAEKAMFLFVGSICKITAAVILVFPRQGKSPQMDVIYNEAVRAKDQKEAVMVTIRRDRRDDPEE